MFETPLEETETETEAEGRETQGNNKKKKYFGIKYLFFITFLFNNMVFQYVLLIVLFKCYCCIIKLWLFRFAYVSLLKRLS